MDAAPSIATGITHRAPKFDFESVPRHWFAGLPFPTQMANGVNLLFPAGERFFVRSVRRYLDRIDDETLRAQVKAFFAQEGQHANSHEKFFRAMEAHGYRVRPFLGMYEFIAYRVIEPMSPPQLRLAATAALEHYTAIMAEGALRERMLDFAHPTMAALLMWHAAEEIEHKAVAFDVLQHVNPSYALRMAGLVMATVTLGGFWAAATAMLLAQDRRSGEKNVMRRAAQLQREIPLHRRVFLRGIREYVRRDFHPSQNDNYALAREYLERAGMAG
jgi:predicted metal-dependent hydrolase